MAYTPNGLFALRSGVLVKFNAATLQQEQIFELFGKVPTPPAANDAAARQVYFADMQRRQAPALLIPRENDLLVIIGDGFARINQMTLAVEANADLAAAQPAPNAGGFRQEPAPGYVMHDNTLYLMRNREILALSITDGKILSRTALPQELQPLPQAGNQGMRPNNPGGNNAGGNRGGNNAGGNRGGGNRGGN